MTSGNRSNNESPVTNQPVDQSLGEDATLNQSKKGEGEGGEARTRRDIEVPQQAVGACTQIGRGLGEGAEGEGGQEVEGVSGEEQSVVEEVAKEKHQVGEAAAAAVAAIVGRH